MDTIDQLRRQFAYDTWANLEVLAAVRAAGDQSSRPLQLIAHITSAGRLWWERIQQQPQSTPVWPEVDLEKCEADAREVGRMWHEYLETLSPEGIAGKVNYKNSKGEPWTSTVQDVLTHVLMHGAYHRGQAASFMRANGREPAYTDFIHAVRNGFVE